MPYFLEGGTPNVLGVAGLAAGLAWVAERGPEANRRHEVALLQQVVDWVEARPDGWKIAGRWEPDDPRRGPLADHAGPRRPHPQDLADILDTSFEIAVRPGLHCALTSTARLGTFPDGTLRLSPGPFTTAEEIDAFLDALTEITAGVL